jgi:hypothetical protein
MYSGLPDGTRALFGRKMNNVYLPGNVDSPVDNVLSGGEIQRMTVTRTFMRSSTVEQRVGLLRFDETSDCWTLLQNNVRTSSTISPFDYYLLCVLWQIYSPGFETCEETDNDLLCIPST